MKVDLFLLDGPTNAGPGAAAAEQAGYSASWVAEFSHDSFISLALAATQTEHIELGTGIAVAFARSPMITASAANDVHLISKGRLLLGLGSQVRAHITRRYSMPWSAPAARMREYVAALHAIWATWNEGAKLDFRGDFYTHTLMTDTFAARPNPYGAPPVFLAAVGTLMTEVAGEVADGLMCHPFTTERYIREVTLPALTRGAAVAARPAGAVAVSVMPLIATGRTEEEFAQAKMAARQRLAFYGSTPAYLPVLELHGWGALHTELWTMSKRGEWAAMGELIDDEVLETFALVGEPDQIGPLAQRRFGDIADRLGIAPEFSSPEALAPTVEALRNAD